MPLYSKSGYGSGRYGLGDDGPIYSLPLSYYVGLLTSEYRMAPNLNSWLYALLGPLDDATNSIATMAEQFDFDSAVGAQLDILGQLIAQPRTVAFQPSGGASPVLDDETYRLLLRATLAFNRWDGLVSSLQPSWQELFPGGRISIIDNQNMTATILVSGGFTPIVQDLITHGYIVPRPETVEYTYIFGNLPLFGFGTVNNGYIAGFDLGSWS